MTAEAAEKQTREFKTELKQLLHLITHSLYSNREIFLRELISNASDAINRVKFDSLDDDAKLEGDKDWKIKLAPDKDAGTLTVTDNGVGLSPATAEENLGTIAKSGTKAFLENVKAANAAGRPEMIGQFGVGFYSAFMVADRVVVVSREAGPPENGVRWESDGQGEYTLEAYSRPKRGTDVILHLKDDAKEFLDTWKLREVVKKFSDFVEYPIVVDVEKPAEEGKEPEKSEETINTRAAIWRRSKSEVTADEHAEFYKQLSGDTEPPARVLHYTAEGNQEFKVLMYIPSHKPFSMQFETPKPGLKLYAQRVLIMDPCEELLPAYLCFIRGVLDSSDLPLNISRETLQHNPLLAGMRKNVLKNAIDGLAALRNVEREKYAKFFAEMGGFLKEGVARDWDNREKLADLLLFGSAKTPAGETVTLSEYVEKMPEGQDEIHYLIGDDRGRLINSPYLEAYKAKDQDVLLLTDPLIDEYFTPALTEYKGKKLARIDQGDYEPDDDAPIEGAERFHAVLAYVKERLPEVREVKLSRRLTDSAAVLVGAADGVSPQLKKLMERMGQPADADAEKRILELNPNHPAVEKLRERHEADADDAALPDHARLLFEQALIAEGSRLPDPAGFAKRVNDLLVR